jgi:tetratricopeptide (TPR) repeat protein
MRALHGRIGPLVALALIAPALAWTSSRVLGAMGRDARYDVLYVPEGRSLAFLSAPLRLTVANAYWLSTVQYVGDQALRRGDYDRLFPLVDLVTDLDPQHGYAYQTAGIVLSAADRLDESDRILRKGMDRGPGWWSYPFYLAFNAFFYRQDYAAAAAWAERAARTPGASTNISHLAMALKVKSGDPEDAVRFLEEMRGTTRDEKSAAAVDEQLRIAILQRDFAAIDGAIDAYRARAGRAPRSLDDLVRSGDLPAVPVDPWGRRYVLGADGRAESRSHNFRLKAPAPAAPAWRPPGFPP